MPSLYYQCHYLDRQNPFLKLGPFKYEPLNDVPHVAAIREFAFPKELETMKDQVCNNVIDFPCVPCDVKFNCSHFSSPITEKNLGPLYLFLYVLLN